MNDNHKDTEERAIFYKGQSSGQHEEKEAILNFLRLEKERVLKDPPDLLAYAIAEKMAALIEHLISSIEADDHVIKLSSKK